MISYKGQVKDQVKGLSKGLGYMLECWFGVQVYGLGIMLELRIKVYFKRYVYILNDDWVLLIWFIIKGQDFLDGQSFGLGLWFI